MEQDVKAAARRLIARMSQMATQEEDPAASLAHYHSLLAQLALAQLALTYPQANLGVCVDDGAPMHFMVVPNLLGLLGILANPSLDAIAALLGTPEGATIGWIHFLAFDLFVGRWAYLDSRNHSFSAWLVSPILFFVLMFGPLGLLFYLALRGLLLRSAG